MEDKERAVDRGRIRVTPRWFDYINLLVAFLAPALTLGPIIYLLILADKEIAPSNIEDGYLQSVIPSPQLFIFGVFTYCGFLVAVALFRSESASALLFLGKRRKLVEEQINDINQEIYGIAEIKAEQTKTYKELEIQIKTLTDKINKLEGMQVGNDGKDN